MGGSVRRGQAGWPGRRQRACIDISAAAPNEHGSPQNVHFRPLLTIMQPVVRVHVRVGVAVEARRGLQFACAAAVGPLACAVVGALDVCAVGAIIMMAFLFCTTR